MYMVMRVHALIAVVFMSLVFPACNQEGASVAPKPSSSAVSLSPISTSSSDSAEIVDLAVRWRPLSTCLFYDSQDLKSNCESEKYQSYLVPVRVLELTSDKKWYYIHPNQTKESAVSFGSWKTVPIEETDWLGWKYSSPYPNYSKKIFLDNWNLDKGMGPLVAGGGNTTEFLWVIYRVESVKGTMWIKFGRSQ